MSQLHSSASKVQIEPCPTPDCDGAGGGASTQDRHVEIEPCPVPDCDPIREAITTLVYRLSMESWGRDPSGARDMLAQLREVRARLARHVADVEGPEGVVRHVSDRCPRLRGEAHRLCIEHQDLDARLGELEHSLAKYEGSDPAEYQKIRQAAARLLQALRDHQHTGDALLLDARVAGGEE